MRPSMALCATPKHLRLAWLALAVLAAALLAGCSDGGEASGAPSAADEPLPPAPSPAPAPAANATAGPTAAPAPVPEVTDCSGPMTQQQVAAGPSGTIGYLDDKACDAPEHGLNDTVLLEAWATLGPAAETVTVCVEDPHGDVAASIDFGDQCAVSDGNPGNLTFTAPGAALYRYVTQGASYGTAVKVCVSVFADSREVPAGYSALGDAADTPCTGA